MSDAGATATPASGNTRVRSPYVIAVICGMAAFMEVLDMSIANVSLLHIAGSLSASREEATWVLTSYLVANAIILPMTGWLSDRFGRKQLFITSVVGFVVASMLCGIATSLPNNSSSASGCKAVTQGCSSAGKACANQCSSCVLQK